MAESMELYMKVKGKEENRRIKLSSNPSLNNVNRENLDPNTSSFIIPLTFAMKVTHAGYTDRGFLVRVIIIITIRFGARNVGKRLVRAWVNLIAPTSSGFHYRVHERGGGLPCGNGGGARAFFVFLLVGFFSGLEKARKAKGSSFLAAATYAPRRLSISLNQLSSPSLPASFLCCGELVVSVFGGSFN
ncbi:hypothetical protein OIU79_015532 [Salix purpurea]|uniref:Uncharacterized protein n=1 Tax=Salix purpurea TaxID=77065 RepID=A0A9Q0SQ18_SALPP|nr:hypothetical protein OIU79_015532 [Salix purpurea]